MNIVFFGTPEAALPSLERLLASGHKIKLIVTQPDRPCGRGLKLTPPPVKKFALEHGLPFIQPEKIKKDQEALALIRSLSPDIIVVVAYGQILPAEIIFFPPYKAINVHFSLLPKYRGACPVAWAILNGEEKTGVTIFVLNERMDEGDILTQVEVEINPEENAGELENRLAQIGADLLVTTLANLDKLTPQPQDHSQATYAPKLDKNLGQIDWSWPAFKIDRYVRGLNPWPGTFTFFRGERIKIIRGRPLFDLATACKPGEIVRWSQEGIEVGCGDGYRYRLEVIQRENRREMNAYEAALGLRIKPGEAFEMVVGE